MVAGRVLAGHPVDVASGVQFTAAHDVEVGGGLPLILRRVYSTAFLGQRPTALGPGWKHHFDVSLVRDLEGFQFDGHEGSTVCFDDEDGSFEQSGSILNRAESMELRREGDLLVVYHWHDLDEPVQRYVFRSSEDGPMRLFARELPSGAGA